MEASDEAAQTFLAELYSVIGCDSVECLRLTEVVDAWLDETGAVDGQPLNHLATHLAMTCGIDAPLHGVVVVLAADTAGRSVGLTQKQVHVLTRLVKTSLPRTPPVIRDEVATLAGLGPLPSEDSPEPLVPLLDTYEQLVRAITRPVSIDEARALVAVLPTTEDSCFGLAWTVLHLIESCPDWPGDDDLGNGPWPDVLRERLRNELNI